LGIEVGERGIMAKRSNHGFIRFEKELKRKKKAGGKLA
jgi:hypothetical protein